ncbi:hypothetical protein ACMSI6_08540 [Pseudomonas antarctica]|uniref:Uncharacterized protein n=1 Tax=Pseudomonas antarctica TaxID=219572 RepID=A0A1G9X180_9PSED|nr:hypothetical protein [Pseudomonas antarctica]KAF2409710.1 hypothetical protein PSAN_21250 [Pseudomonas antarctica]SDM90206.1 hypothetical protein SAMN04490179_1498 [Pseudomonas antarctica]
MATVSSFSPRPIFLSHVAAPVETVAVPAVQTATAHTDAVRSKRSAALPDSPDVRASADAQLAQSFARALATRSYQTSMAPPNVQVSLQSTLGRWRTHLDSAFKGPGFLAWAKEQGLDTRRLKLDPARGELTGSVDGKTHTFSLKDDSGWSDVSRTLLSIAKVIAPEAGQAFSYPWPQGEVPCYTVGRFYNEPIDLTPAQFTLHRKKLLKNVGFEFPPLAYASLRSAEAIAGLNEALGDDADRHALICALTSQVDDAAGKIDLDKVKIPIDPRSSRFKSEHLREMSVASILKQDGNRVPVNSKQALSVALALSFDLAHRAPQMDAGGVKPLAGMLGATSLRKMRARVAEWKNRPLTHVSNPQAGGGAGSLLRRLMDALPESARKGVASNPSLALDSLIRSPEAQGLGKEIQKTLKLVETPTSAIESVSAALVQELDPGAGKSAFNLAGYNLYSQDNVGASAADITKRFTTYLERQVGSELAPVAAQLLLSAAAPECVVKQIPPNLVYGSHTWVNFCIEVARIELQVPGASANMTFSQVMAFGNAPPISLEGEDQLGEVARDPILAWGVANGIIQHRLNREFTDVDATRSQAALNKQQKELAWAKTVLQTPATTREKCALTELKRVFPNIDPTLDVVQDTSIKHTPVSLLDIYMTGPIKPDRWKSLDNKKFPYDEMKSRLSLLKPDINTTFSDRFQAYKKEHEIAWALQFKYQLSLLPLADQESIQKSKVSFIEVSRPYLKTALDPRGSNLFPGRRPRTPTEPELEALKGKQGLLMKVQGPDGRVSAYSYLPTQGRLVKEKGYPGERTDFDDSGYFNGGAAGRVPGSSNVFVPYGVVNSDRDPPGNADKTHGAYFSERNGTLGLTAGLFFTRDYEALQYQAAGVTALEKGKALDKKLKDFFLGLVPFYDGVQEAISGSVGGAIFNIGFDLFGFFLPGLNAARKAFKAGRGPLNIIKSGVFAGVGASVGYTDTVDIARNVNKGSRAGYKDINYLATQAKALLSRLKGNYRRYDVTKIYREGDIVKGFLRSAEDNVWRPTVAIFKKGGWYAYNVITKTPFGLQAAQFGAVMGVAD